MAIWPSDSPGLSSITSPGSWTTIVPVLDAEFSFTDRGGPDDDYYYVRVEQLDGHRAWSSPWWVGGERPR